MEGGSTVKAWNGRKHGSKAFSSTRYVRSKLAALYSLPALTRPPAFETALVSSGSPFVGRMRPDGEEKGGHAHVSKVRLPRRRAHSDELTSHIIPPWTTGISMPRSRVS